jgi:signal transduction histidine kinase/ligand-binding sensor domain-containing protein
VVVNDIAEDPHGGLWVATNGGGVARLTDTARSLSTIQETAPGAKRRFYSFKIGPEPASNRVNAILFDSAEHLWAVTDDGLYRSATGSNRDPEFKLVEAHSPVTEKMSAFADSRGRLWFGMGVKLLQVVEGRIRNHSPPDGAGPQKVRSIVEDRQGNLFFADEQSLYEFVAPPGSDARGSWRRFPLDLTPRQSIHSLLCDSSGALWVGTTSGLIKYKDGKQTLYTEAQGLGSEAIEALSEDRDGNLWVGTLRSGISKLSGELIVSFTQAEGLPALTVGKVVEDRRGRIYACLPGGGAAEIVEGKAVPVPGSQTSGFMHSIPFQDWRGDWWVTAGGTLFRFDGPELQFRRGRMIGASDGLPGGKSYVVSIENAPFEKRYLTDGWDLYRVNFQGINGRAVFERIALTPPLPVIASWALTGRDGAVWLGGHSVLARWMNGKVTLFSPSEGLPEINPRVFFQDSRGWLWIGTRYRGVSVTKDPTAEVPRFVNYSTAQGLSSNAIWAITEDDEGRMYLGGGKGLDQFDPSSGRVRRFNSSDGLAGDEVYHCLKDRDGNVWAAASMGLSKFNPRAQRIDDRPPSTYISRAQAAGEDLPIAETGETWVGGLELPSARNNLLVEFVALSFHGERRLRYQYMLEGIDADWSRPSETRSVNYARLAPGSYRFLARAINEEGAMSPAPAVLQFRILPPLWQRWWFLTLVATAAGLAGYVFYRYRVAQLLKLERVRTRIATDLHDDIGANLTRISILSEVAKQFQDRRANNDSPVSVSLQSIAEIARESVASMSDIVWAINPDRDSLLDLTRKMRQHAEEVFALRDIELKFIAPDAAQDLALDAHVRRDLYLIFKELVSNAARHSECARAEIELRLERPRLTLTVFDDGRGFDPAAGTDGNGLVNIRRRAAALAGEFALVSRPGGGVRARLTVPLTRSWLGE